MPLLESKRGSVLIVAAIFAIILAIAVAGYLQVARTSMKLANRSFYLNAAINLTDIGLEQALWSMNHSNWTGAGFTARGEDHPSEWQGTFPSSSPYYYQLAPGVTGQVKVWVNAGGTTPQAVVKATITLSDGTTLIKEAEARMKSRSYFVNGLVAKQSITFSGNNAEVDSWNSDPNNSGTPVPYSAGVAHDHGAVVGCTSVLVDSIAVSNANIYGYVAVGGHTLGDISVGPQGVVGPYGTPNGTIDTTRVTFDFTTSFPDVSAPTQDSTGEPLTGANTNTLAAITNTLTLPRTDAHGNILDNVASDGTYYYSVSSISLSGHAALSVTGPLDAHGQHTPAKVVITVLNSIGTTVSVSGQAGITIGTSSSLAMYTAGNVSISGNGVANGTSTTNQPINFQFYGTLPAAQTPPYQSISIVGNGVLSGVVYAPNAAVSMCGGGNQGQVLGAMVGNTISLTGNSVFHYDESLANFGGSNLWTLSSWDELARASERNAYATVLNF